MKIKWTGQSGQEHAKSWYVVFRVFLVASNFEEFILVIYENKFQNVYMFPDIFSSLR